MMSLSNSAHHVFISPGKDTKKDFQAFSRKWQDQWNKYVSREGNFLMRLIAIGLSLLNFFLFKQYFSISYFIN